MSREDAYPWRFSLFLAAYYTANSVYQGYVSVYFSNKGLDSFQIGMLMSAVSVVSIFSQLGWGALGDRSGSRQPGAAGDVRAGRGRGPDAVFYRKSVDALRDTVPVRRQLHRHPADGRLGDPGSAAGKGAALRQDSPSGHLCVRGGFAHRGVSDQRAFGPHALDDGGGIGLRIPVHLQAAPRRGPRAQKERCLGVDALCRQKADAPDRAGDAAAGHARVLLRVLPGVFYQDARRERGAPGLGVLPVGGQRDAVSPFQRQAVSKDGRGEAPSDLGGVPDRPMADPWQSPTTCGWRWPRSFCTAGASS